MSTKKPYEWKVGDTCYLNSGSPQMTIVGYEQPIVTVGNVHYMITVAWVHYETGMHYSAVFPAAALRRFWK